MLLTRLLNACYHFAGFVYAAARLDEASGTIEIDVRPRRGSKPHCSCCGKTAPGYDVLPTRRFEFIPIWGFAVELLYGMRRVQCRRCGVKVEQVPWAMGKHSLTQAYMLYLAHWARKLSWQETALSFGTTWEQVCHAVEYVVQWGLAHRELGPLRAIGVDEIAVARGHRFVTLVYQIEADCVRLLWVGKERTTQSFEQFFTLIGAESAGRIEFVCSDMWRPYLQLIARHCTRALNILDRFHIVAKLNKALDEVRAGEARRMVREGYEPLLRKKRWCLLKRPENLTDHQRMSLRELLGYNLKSVRAYLLKEEFQLFQGLHLTGLGRQIPRRLVHPGDALAHRASEEVRPHAALAPRVAAQLLPRQKAVLQRHHRGAEQQGQSHHEKSVRLSELPHRRALSVPRAWQAPRA
jgi:transposase